jgi:hypothetical protein
LKAVDAATSRRYRYSHHNGSTTEKVITMKKVKVTKRQRKAQGRNFMVQYCKTNGMLQEVGGTRYMGKMSFSQTQPSVPFVRV